MGSSIIPRASRDTVPSKTLSCFSPKMTGAAPWRPLNRNDTSPILRVISDPSARVKVRFECGRTPSFRSNAEGMTE